MRHYPIFLDLRGCFGSVVEGGRGGGFEVPGGSGPEWRMESKNKSKGKKQKAKIKNKRALRGHF
jgi:hypothetical protein